MTARAPYATISAMTKTLAPLAAVLLILVGGVALLYAMRAQNPPTTAPTPTATVAAITSTPIATAPSATNVSSTLATYFNKTYQYSLALPAPYRHSDHLSYDGVSGRPAAQDVFTARMLADEAAGESGETASPNWNYVVVVHVFTGVGLDTPRSFYTSFGGAVGESIADTTVDGRQAIKVTNGMYPLQYVIKDGTRIFSVSYQTYESFSVPAGATKEKLVAMIESFRFTP
jgi:hypothetical protein